MIDSILRVRRAIIRDGGTFDYYHKNGPHLIYRLPYLVTGAGVGRLFREYNISFSLEPHTLVDKARTCFFL